MQMAADTRSAREKFPELYATDGRGIDRRGAQRVVPMKVLVLGLCRTGTASMWAALKELGYLDTYHMMSVVMNPSDADLWMEAVQAKYYGKGTPYTRAGFDALMGHCMAATDFPPAAFAPELIAAYPEAKVILTTRDVDAWYVSTRDTIGKALFRTPLAARLMVALDPWFMRPWFGMSRAMFVGFFQGEKFEEEIAKRVFREHYEKVRSLVPADRLLEYKVGAGWEPLCEFLGVEVPGTPFPRVNETAAFDERIEVMVKRSMWKLAKPVLFVASTLGVGFGAWWYLQR